MQLFLITHDSENWYVVAKTLSRAVKRWQTSLALEVADDVWLTADPDSMVLVSADQVIV